MGVVIHSPNPFAPADRHVHPVRRPMSVRQAVGKMPGLRRHTSVRQVGGRRVREFDRPTVCFHNGKPLLRKDWSRTAITEHDVVFFFTPPAGGNAGSAIVGIILAVAVAVAAPYLAGLAGGLLGPAFAAGTIGGQLLTAGIGMALMAAATGVMSLFAAPPPSAQNYSSGYAGASGVAAQTSPTYSSSGFSQNTARLGQPIPVLHGRHMVVPDYAMPPITRYEDNKQYIHAFLIITQGNCDIEAVRIGETPISSYASITWEKVEPGAVPNPAICDVRMLPCRDIADVELPDYDAGSTWKGPFAANPPGTAIDHVEVDIVCPRGLYHFNASGGFDARSVSIQVEAQEIDIAGDPVGAWIELELFTITEADSAPQRVTKNYWTPSVGRWQVRVRRTDSKDTAANAGHQANWTGLRGILTTDRKVAGVTGMVIKMEVNGDLNGSTSRQVNVIATRRLPTYDFTSGSMTTAEAPTRSICDAFVDIARNNRYGGRKPDRKIDLAGIYANAADFEAKGWEFNFVWDQSVTEWEALGRVARACIAERIVQGQKLRLVRDLPPVGAVMMFSSRNIRPETFEIEQKLIDDETSDGLVGNYMDTRSWRPGEITVAFDDSAQENLTRVALHGITVRSQGREVLYNLLRGNRYRRRIVGWGTEAEGLMVLYGDGIAVSHDMPKWGQSAEALGWDPETRIMEVSEALTFAAAGTHYVAIQDRKGELTGPFTATKANDDGSQIVVGPGALPTIYTGGRAERTMIQFGLGESYAKRLKVIGVTPRSDLSAQVLAIDDDPRMYDPIPPEEEDAPPVGAPVDPLDIHVTANTAGLNMRALANAHGFTGNPAQAVTITIDAGVHVYSPTWGAFAVVRGTWPPGFVPKLVNRGTISGAGGTGGDAGEPGQSGQAGYHAIDTRSGKVAIDNAGGVIRGGGGGGGSGGNSVYAGGGGGGGGAGLNGPAGGSVNNPSASAIGGSGQAGTSTSGGAGGPGGEYYYDPGDGTAPTISNGAAGGAGGGWGQGGTYGGNPFDPGTFGAPGGPAGWAVVGVSNVTWIADGTCLGPLG